MLTLKKNDEIEVTIEDIGTSGEGIGRVDGAVLFVRDAVPGDHILAGITKVKKTYAYARLIRIITPSPDRVDPKCAYAGPCGGCQLQTLSYERQLEFKMRKVKDVLERIGGFSVTLPGEPEGKTNGKTSASTNTETAQIHMEPIIGSDQPYHYRNKAQFPIGTSKDGRIITGFYAGRSHRIIENRDCALGVPVNRQILDVVIAHMEQNGIPAYDETSGKGLVRHVLIRKGFATGQILVCVVINGKSIPYEDQLADDLFAIPGMHSFSVNVNMERTNVILGAKVRLIRGGSYITEKLQDITYRVSPKSFFQVNTKQTEKLYATALEYAGLTGNETVWDLYCGAGTISLFLARKAKHVYGVEIVPEAIQDAKENAKLNGVENVTFYTGKAEEIVPAFYEAKKESDEEAAHPDVIVVDPPRKGCDASLLQTMLEMTPERIVYISCDPATLARDLRILSDGGYQINRIRPVDQFLQTVHCEVIVSMSRVGSRL